MVQQAKGVDERSAHAEPDAPAWSLGSPGGGAGPREVDARYLRGTWQVDQGHQLVRQVAGEQCSACWFAQVRRFCGQCPVGLSVRWAA